MTNVMAKKILPLAALMLLTLCSCSKERHCKCTTTDVPDDGLLKVMVIDRSLKCESITEMGFEQKIVDENGQTLQRVDMHTVSCRDYAE